MRLVGVNVYVPPSLVRSRRRWAIGGSTFTAVCIIWAISDIWAGRYISATSLLICAVLNASSATMWWFKYLQGRDLQLLRAQGWQPTMRRIDPEVKP